MEKRSKKEGTMSVICIGPSNHVARFELPIYSESDSLSCSHDVPGGHDDDAATARACGRLLLEEGHGHTGFLCW